jgi:hypothetical protein
VEKGFFGKKKKTTGQRRCRHVVSQTQSGAVKNSTAPRIRATTSHDDDNRRCKRVGSRKRERERERERVEPAGDGDYVRFHLFLSYGGVKSSTW